MLPFNIPSRSYDVPDCSLSFAGLVSIASTTPAAASPAAFAATFVFVARYRLI